MFSTLWKLLAKRRSGRPTKKQRTRSVRLSLDYLEDRITPAPMIITVKNLSDAVVPPSFGPDLRQAIAIANLPANAGSTINFAVNGVITLVQKDLIIKQPMTIDGIGHTVTISGNHASRDFLITTPGTVTLANLTIKFGKTNASEPSGSGFNGGGIDDTNPNSILNLNTDKILSNTAASPGNGGGVYSKGIVNISATSLVDGNTAPGGNGGGVWAAKNITVNASTISNNTAIQGGGIYQSGTGTTVKILNGSTVTINKATGSSSTSPIPGNGGGVWALFNAVVTDSSVTHNVALNGGSGGGVYSEDGNVTLTGATISDNTATGEGGGVWADFNVYVNADPNGTPTDVNGNIANTGGGGIWANDGFVKLAGSTVENNTAGAGGTPGVGDGGGIWSGTNVTLDSTSLVTNNTANGNGGGIFATHSVTMNGGTVSNNQAVSSTFDESGNPINGSGGGIWAGFDVTMIGGLVDGNTAGLNGGGIFDNGGNGTGSVVDLNTEAVVSNNTAGNDGGGIYALGANVSIDATTVTGNSADHNGGGVWVSVIPAGQSGLEEFGSLFVFDGSIFSSNTALNEGGGIYVEAIEAVTIDSTTFDGNIASQNGGAIAARNVVNLSITNSTFTNNQATSGSGGAIFVIGPSDVYIDSCSFGTDGAPDGNDGNTAGKFGGAIYLASAQGTTLDATINNCFFDSNVAYGGPHSGSDLFADTGAIVDLNNSDFDDTLGLSSTLSTDLIDTGNTGTYVPTGTPGEIDSSGGNEVWDNSYVFVTNFGFAGSNDLANDLA